MPIDFPNTPTNGQIFTVGDRSWQWNSTLNIWESVASSAQDPIHPLLLIGA